MHANLCQIDHKHVFDTNIDNLGGNVGSDTIFPVLIFGQRSAVFEIEAEDKLFRANDFQTLLDSTLVRN